MKKTLFDTRLYREGLRQLCPIGIVQLAVYTVFSVLSVMLSIRYLNSGGENPFAAFFMIVYPIIYVFPVLYTLYLFRFQMKRSTDDFYHSLPQTRVCLSLSFLAAVMSWYLAGLIVPAAVTCGAAALCGYAVPLWSIVSTVIGAAIAGLLAVAGAFLAAAISGRIFSALCATVMILFVPRLLLSSLVTTVLRCIAVLDLSTLNWFLQDIHLLASFGSLTSQPAWLYSALLALLYLVLGIWAFCRRPAETAEKSAVSRGMQTLYRLTVSFVCCLPMIHGLYSELTQTSVQYDLSGAFANVSETGLYILGYVFVIAVYFLFELITTRKAKNLLKAIPWLGVLAAMNIAVLTGMIAVTQTVFSYQPSTAQVESVSVDEIVTITGVSSKIREKQMAAFEESGKAGALLTDQSCRMAASTALRSAIRENDNDWMWLRQNGDNGDILYIEYYYECKYYLKVTLYSDGVGRQRVLSFNKSDYERFMDCLGVVS